MLSVMLEPKNRKEEKEKRILPRACLSMSLVLLCILRTTLIIILGKGIMVKNQEKRTLQTLPSEIPMLARFKRQTGDRMKGTGRLVLIETCGPMFLFSRRES